MQKASRDARRGRAKARPRQGRTDEKAPVRAVGGLLLAFGLCAAPAQSVHAQPVPLAVKATQHWVLYTRLHGGEPFVVTEADGARSRLWWFDGQGRPAAVVRVAPSSADQSPGGPGGPPGLIVVLPRATPTGSVRVAVPPTPSPERRHR